MDTTREVRAGLEAKLARNEKERERKRELFRLKYAGGATPNVGAPFIPTTAQNLAEGKFPTTAASAASAAPAAETAPSGPERAPVFEDEVLVMHDSPVIQAVDLSLGGAPRRCKPSPPKPAAADSDALARELEGYCCRMYSMPYNMLESWQTPSNTVIIVQTADTPGAVRAVMRWISELEPACVPRTYDMADLQTSLVKFFQSVWATCTVPVLINGTQDMIERLHDIMAQMPPRTADRAAQPYMRAVLVVPDAYAEIKPLELLRRMSTSAVCPVPRLRDGVLGACLRMVVRHINAASRAYNDTLPARVLDAAPGDAVALQRSQRPELVFTDAQCASFVRLCAGDPCWFMHALRFRSLAKETMSMQVFVNDDAGLGSLAVGVRLLMGTMRTGIVRIQIERACWPLLHAAIKDHKKDFSIVSVDTRTVHTSISLEPVAQMIGSFRLRVPLRPAPPPRRVGGFALRASAMAFVTKKTPAVTVTLSTLQPPDRLHSVLLQGVVSQAKGPVRVAITHESALSQVVIGRDARTFVAVNYADAALCRVLRSKPLDCKRDAKCDCIACEVAAHARHAGQGTCRCKKNSAWGCGLCFRVFTALEIAADVADDLSWCDMVTDVFPYREDLSGYADHVWALTTNARCEAHAVPAGFRMDQTAAFTKYEHSMSTSYFRHLQMVRETNETGRALADRFRPDLKARDDSIVVGRLRGAAVAEDDNSNNWSNVAALQRPSPMLVDLQDRIELFWGHYIPIDVANPVNFACDAARYAAVALFLNPAMPGEFSAVDGWQRTLPPLLVAHALADWMSARCVYPHFVTSMAWMMAWSALAKSVHANMGVHGVLRRVRKMLTDALALSQVVRWPDGDFPVPEHWLRGNFRPHLGAQWPPKQMRSDAFRIYQAARMLTVP